MESVEYETYNVFDREAGYSKVGFNCLVGFVLASPRR